MPETLSNHAFVSKVGIAQLPSASYPVGPESDNPVAQALSKPGHELQHRFSTAEPTPEQLEVAEAALAACLELEHGADDQN